jgi:hypothetical protein
MPVLTAEQIRVPPEDLRKESLSQKLNRVFEGMHTERNSFRNRWKELGEYILPTRPREFDSDSNKGDRSKTKIIDSTATEALAVASAGLLAGMASPSRPWFTLTVPGMRVLSKATQIWLEEFRDAILGVFERSNFYTSLGQLLADELVFGTSVMMILRHPTKVIRCQIFPIMSYSLAQNVEGNVETFAREVTMTAEQMVNEFGIENVSHDVARDYMDPGGRQHAQVVRHIIMRNDRGRSFPASSSLPFVEYYWESHGAGTKTTGPQTPVWDGRGKSPGGSESGGVLRVGGYQEFPIIAARWDRNDEDVYATSCPGMVALGHIKQLQSMQRIALNGLAKMVNPPLVGGPHLEGKPASLMAGAMTYDDGLTANAGVRPVHEVRLPLEAVEAKMMETRESIRRIFMVDLFKMISLDNRKQRATAEEVIERRQEKLSVLGPVLERHSDDVFDKVIDRTASMMIRLSRPDWEQDLDGLVPIPPPDLEGLDLRVLYTSDVAKAQRLAALEPLERHMGFAASLVEVSPEALDLVDVDTVVREHAEILSLTPAVTRDDQAVAEVRMRRQAEQQAAAMRESAPGLAKAARDLSETETPQGSGATALDQVVASAEG